MSSWLRSAFGGSSNKVVSDTESHPPTLSPSPTRANSNSTNTINASNSSNFINPLNKARSLAGLMVQRAGDVVERVMEKAAAPTATHPTSHSNSSPFRSPLSFSSYSPLPPINSSNNLVLAIRRLDDVSLTSRGAERSQAIERWLQALREIDSHSKGGKGGSEREEESGATSKACASELYEQLYSYSVSELGEKEGEKGGEKGGPRGEDEERSADKKEEEDSSKMLSKAHKILFFDPHNPASPPLNFRGAFLKSRALENIVVSLVVHTPPSSLLERAREEREGKEGEEATEEKDFENLRRMFKYTLTGSPQLHAFLLDKIKRVRGALTQYADIKIPRDDLLRMVADVITGLKMNPEIERLSNDIDIISRSIEDKGRERGGEKERVKEGEKGDEGLESERKLLRESVVSGGMGESSTVFSLSLQLLEKLKSQKNGMQQGDSEEKRKEKIKKLDILCAELSASSNEIAAKIEENKLQAESALKYQKFKNEGVLEAEKTLALEMNALQKRQMELEAELKKVREDIHSLSLRHSLLMEEKEQFDEANEGMRGQMDEEQRRLCLLLSQQRADRSAFSISSSFLEASWKLQEEYDKRKQQKLSETSADVISKFVDISTMYLTACEGELTTSLSKLMAAGQVLEDIKAKRAELEARSVDGVVADVSNSRRKNEEAYVVTEFKMKTVARAAEKATVEFLRWKQEIESEQQKLHVSNGSASGVQTPIGTPVADFSAPSAALIRIESILQEFKALVRPVLEIENPNIMIRVGGGTRGGRAVRKSEKASESWGTSVREGGEGSGAGSGSLGVGISEAEALLSMGDEYVVEGGGGTGEGGNSSGTVDAGNALLSSVSVSVVPADNLSVTSVANNPGGSAPEVPNF